jgi:hypothetical protein
MGLGRQMQDCVGLFPGQDARYPVAIAHVEPVKFVLRMTGNAGKRGEVGGVG